MKIIKEYYFKTHTEWRAWLHDHHASNKGVHLIFYSVSHEQQSMRWEEAVKVALCYGWIDSTVKSLGDGKRRQYFCPRKPKSPWSKLNKKHLQELIATGKMHTSGLNKIAAAKKDGSWNALDDVENGIIPNDLQAAFDKEPEALKNYNGFARSYRKSYLYWLKQAKRTETREKRIREIVQRCKDNIKSRNP